MPSPNEPLQNFNLDTMSGVYPGTRTQQYQRLRLRLLDGDRVVEWSQLQWYLDPASVALFVLPATADRTAPIWRSEPPPDASALVETLNVALSARSEYVEACGTCVHFRSLTGVSDDGLPIGRCGWGQGDAATATQLPSVLAIQSAFAVGCDQFLRNPMPGGAAQTATAAELAQVRVPKSAELDPDRLPFWPRLWHRVVERLGKPQPPVSWAEQLVERSGVGAGTEPCFVCHGRLANLGALAVAAPEGDKQTFSVWRCRSCYSIFLNDWIDRWERLDSLETEESVYRLAPAEAVAALTIIHAATGADHPGGRDERHPQRAQMNALISGKSAISHQIRQGR